jgi:O-antigen ligase
LLGPAAMCFKDEKTNYPALLLIVLGAILLVLTFSRSAWLGLLTFIIILIMKSKYVERKKLILLLSVFGVTILLTLYTLRDLVITRVHDQGVTTEQISAGGRSWLAEQAWDTIQKHPLAGIGIGSFVLELATTSMEGAPIEPVHNIFLLVTAELGLPGAILLLALCLLVVKAIVRSKSPPAILAGALVTGLGMINLFDHYLWTIAPGRVMLGLTLGLWAGQVLRDA